jgi:hypothetical protein
MAGPLGEMFDHGNKASSFPFDRDWLQDATPLIRQYGPLQHKIAIAILAARALGLGRSWWTVSSK